MPRVVVVGAGIGGLCAARAVALAGHEAVVLERSPAGAAIGAGLLLWPNAVHALGALGRRAGAPMLVVERPTLHQVLADGVPVRYDASVSAVDGRGVSVAGGERLDADAVIGADGIGSVVREHVCAGTRPIDSGYTVV